MLVLKKEASDSQTQLLACQKDLNISVKETHEALGVVRTGGMDMLSSKSSSVKEPRSI